MKNTPYKISLLSLLGIFACGLPAVVQGAPDAGSMVSSSQSMTDSISGKVTAISDDAMLVDGKTVALTDTTTFIAEGKAISSDDIKAGDEVEVTTSVGEEGILQAISVEVVASSG